MCREVRRLPWRGPLGIRGPNTENPDPGAGGTEACRNQKIAGTCTLASSRPTRPLGPPEPGSRSLSVGHATAATLIYRVVLHSPGWYLDIIDSKSTTRSRTGKNLKPRLRRSGAF